MIYRMTKIKELRATRPNTLLLDAGDQFQGTFWFYVFGGEATSFFMKKLGYDVMVRMVTGSCLECEPSH